VDWDCIQTAECFVLFGDWTLEDIERCRSYFKIIEAQSTLILNLQDVEIVCGTAMAECITLLRELVQKHNQLILIEAPQMLAHTLYKTNMLVDSNIELISPRHDSGIGA